MSKVVFKHVLNGSSFYQTCLKVNVSIKLLFYQIHSVLAHFIVINYFIFLAKILNATGEGPPLTCLFSTYMKEPENKVKSGKYIEIIDLIDTKYKRTFLDEKMDRTGAIGGLLQNQPIICGGYSSSGGGKVFEHECILLGKSHIFNIGSAHISI